MYELEINPPQITQVGPLIPASYPIIEVCGTLFSFGDTGASAFNFSNYMDNNLCFVPGVTQPNTWYSVYAIAGNASGSSVDLNDPCLDVSQAAGVYWYAGPTVSFDGALPFCGGGCQNITATFTGIQPFNLTYSVSFGGGPPQMFNQVFNSSSAAIQICPPAGFSGSIQVLATNLSDAKCPCGP